MFVIVFLVVVSILQQGHAVQLLDKGCRRNKFIPGVTQPPLVTNPDGRLVLPTLYCLDGSSGQHCFPSVPLGPVFFSPSMGDGVSRSKLQERTLNIRSTPSRLYTLTHGRTRSVKRRDEIFTLSSEKIVTTPPIISPCDTVQTIRRGSEKISRIPPLVIHFREHNFFCPIHVSKAPHLPRRRKTSRSSTRASSPLLRRCTWSRMVTLERWGGWRIIYGGRGMWGMCSSAILRLGRNISMAANML